MSQNYINLLIEDLESRWSEIDILLETAQDNRHSNVELHDAICRSIRVLMISNLEGFYKELVKSFINDMNDNNTFSQLPSAVKRGYCLNFLDPQSKPNTTNALIDKLIKEFERLNANINYKPFLYDRNKNPSPKVIDAIFKNLGFRKIFKTLEASKYDDVFQEENSYLDRQIPIYINDLSFLTQSFPYKWTERCFDTQLENPTNKTLWEDFLDEVNRRRHKIAHGDDSSNVDSVQTLKKDRNKLLCLQLALIHVLIEKFGMQTNSSGINETSEQS